jgi:hypothetical protein
MSRLRNKVAHELFKVHVATPTDIAAWRFQCLFPKIGCGMSRLFLMSLHHKSSPTGGCDASSPFKQRLGGDRSRYTCGTGSSLLGIWFHIVILRIAAASPGSDHFTGMQTSVERSLSQSCRLPGLPHRLSNLRRHQSQTPRHQAEQRHG